MSTSEKIDLPDGWCTVSVADAVNNISTNGKKIPQKVYAAQGRYAVIDQGQEHIGGYTDDAEKVIDCQLPVIVFGDHTKVIKYVNQPFAAGADGIKVLEPLEIIIPRFFEYSLQSVSVNMVDKGYARHYQHLAKSLIHLPPLAEQKRLIAKIEELFSELDKGIESLKTAQMQLKVYRQALLKHAFEGKLTEKWRKKNKDKLESADELLKRIQAQRTERYRQQVKEWEDAVKKWEKGGKQGDKPGKPIKPKELAPLTAEELAELPSLPVGWGWVKVGMLCDVVRGGSPRPAGDQRFYGGDIPFLKVADITNNIGPYVKNFTYTIKEAGLTKTRQISQNTLLLSNSGATLGVPKICIINATLNDGLAAFLGLDEDVLLFHYYFWESKTKKLRTINQGAAQPNLNTSLIEEIPFPACNAEEQKIIAQEIETRFSEIDNLDQTINTALQQAETLRQSIFKKSFSGQLVPQDPDDEPASVLLERIKAEKNVQKQAGGGKKRATTRKKKLVTV